MCSRGQEAPKCCLTQQKGPNTQPSNRMRNLAIKSNFYWSSWNGAQRDDLGFGVTTFESPPWGSKPGFSHVRRKRVFGGLLLQTQRKRKMFYWLPLERPPLWTASRNPQFRNSCLLMAVLCSYTAKNVISAGKLPSRNSIYTDLGHVSVFNCYVFKYMKYLHINNIIRLPGVFKLALVDFQCRTVAWPATTAWHSGA